MAKSLALLKNCLSVQKWEKKKFVTLYTRSSRSVEAAKKRTPNRTNRDELKISELDPKALYFRYV